VSRAGFDRDHQATEDQAWRLLSHEIAHLRNRDSAFSLLFNTVTNAITHHATTGRVLWLKQIATQQGVSQP